MKLSVIIPCFNAEQTIGEQLDSLCHQEWSEAWEVVVVDNRSTDRSKDVVGVFFERMPSLRVVDAVERQGQPYALNEGVKAAVGEALAFCDADDMVEKGWVAAMGNALKGHDFVSGPFEIERLNESAVGQNRVNPQPTGVQQYDYPPYLPHAGSGNMGVKRDIFEAVGGFDESLPILFDTDFCWRVQLAGTELYAVPDAIMHVRFRETLQGLILQARLYGEYNVLLYKRYRGRGMPALPLRTGLHAWGRLLRHIPRLRKREARFRWIWHFSWRLGRVYGCVKYRVLAL